MHLRDIQLDHRDIGNGLRPAFIILPACVLAAVLAVMWLHVPRTSRAPAPQAPLSPAQRAAPVTPAPRAALVKPATHSRSAASVQPPVSAGAIASAASTAPDAADSAPLTPMENRWGLRVSGVWLDSGAAVNLAYTVTSTEKIAAIEESKTTAYLVDEASSVKIPLGPPPPNPALSAHSRARSRALTMWQAGSFPPPPSRLSAGKTYTMVLPNPAGAIKVGSKLALVIGDTRTSGLTVE
jgi:hypothetical protein